MQGLTEAHEEEARKLAQRRMTPYLARVAVTIKSVRDVVSAGGKTVYVSLQGDHFMRQSGAKKLGSEIGERFEVGETLEFFAVLGGMENEELLKEETVVDGSGLSGLAECMVSVALREGDAESRIGDFGIMNLADFVYGTHSITDKEVVMKLGGRMYMTIECLLERWEVELDKGIAEDGVHETIEKHIVRRQYGQLYKTMHCNGEWNEYPVVMEMEEPRRIKFWCIEGPDEEESEGDEDLAQVCEARFRVVRRKRKECRVGQVARSGKMSLLQKYRVWAVEPLVSLK